MNRTFAEKLGLREDYEALLSSGKKLMKNPDVFSPEEILRQLSSKNSFQKTMAIHSQKTSANTRPYSSKPRFKRDFDEQTLKQLMRSDKPSIVITDGPDSSDLKYTFSDFHKPKAQRTTLQPMTP